MGVECPLCTNAEETWAHLVFECPVTSQVWAEVGLVAMFRGQCFNSWLETLLGTAGTEASSWCSTLLWFVWKARNDLVWNGKQFVPSGVAIAASSHMEAWSRATTQADRGLGTAPSGVNPELTSRRCYVDATLFARRGVAGIGLVLVNEEGLVMAAKSIMLQSTMDPYFAEVMAVKEALTWIKAKGWREVRVYSDCLNACNSVNGRGMDCSYAGVAVAESRMILRELQDVSIRHIPRFENRLTHNLAKKVEQSMATNEWVFNPPQCNLTLFDSI